jgi:hypothetical protein
VPGWGWCASLAVLSLAGCAAEPEPLVPVKGMLKDRAGRPLANVVVTFHPQDEVNKKGKLAAAVSARDGGFSTECLRGRYKITLAVPPGLGQPDPGGGPAAAPSLTGAGTSIPQEYRDPKLTRLEVDVPAGGTEDLLLRLK